MACRSSIRRWSRSTFDKPRSSERNARLFTMLLTFVLLNFAMVCRADKCYQRADNPFSYFGTKTVYSYVSAEQDYDQPKCKTLQLWLLSRHGTRHPAANVIDRISKLSAYTNITTGNSTLCREDIEAIKSWKFNLTETDGNQLNGQGASDLQSLGFRLRNVYSDIFNEPYDPMTYKVLSSPKSRCVNSAINFLQSAFDTNVADIPLTDEHDAKLNISRFRRIDDDDDTEESGVKEVNAFYHGAHVQRLVRSVSDALGLDSNDLTLDAVKTMYESCRYEKSRYVHSRPAWCAVFSQEDLEILEYGEDLKYYYSIGYGDPYNERIGCPIVKDLITNFRNKSQTRRGPKGVFYFGHSSNVFSTIVRLGIARDTAPLLSSNFDGMRDRQWKSSYLCPFASNVMAVLYECHGVTKVTFFVNGIPMVVEKYGCTLCPWELIDDTFDPIVSSPSCTFDRSSSAPIVSETTVVLFSICLLSVTN